MIFAKLNAFHTAYQIFDCKLNALHLMALMAKKEDNESYTFKQMLQQEDKAYCTTIMMKEASDHESKHY